MDALSRARPCRCGCSTSDWGTKISHAKTREWVVTHPEDAKECRCGCDATDPRTRAGHANRGKKRTAEQRARQSASQKGRPCPPGTIAALTGRPRSPETRRKLSRALRGRSSGRARPFSERSYGLKHRWVAQNFTDPGGCEACGVQWMRLEWASISHTYTQNRADWRRLCARCHRRMDSRNKRS